MERKTMFVSKEVHRYLIDQGRKNETFDQILKRLLGLDKSNQSD